MISAKRLSWVFLILGVILVLLVGMFQPVIGDASLYASISKRMFTNGDYVNLYLIDQEYNQKPHLVFWLSSISYSLFGVNTFAFKLPSVLIGLSGIYALYLFGKKAFSQKVGFWAGFLWLFSLSFLLHANDIHMDTMMSGFILWTVYFWYNYLESEQPKYLFFGAIPLALAMMTKGPLGAFVPVTGFMVAILACKGLGFLFKWHHFVAAGFALLLISPVLINIYHQHGSEGLLFYFWENNAGRVDRGDDQSKDYFFYIHTMAWFFLPWALITFYAFARLMADFWNKKSNMALIFAFGCFIVFFLVASVSDGNAPHYMYTLLPFAALITAFYLWDDEHRNTKSILLWIPTTLLIIANIVGLIYFPPKKLLAIFCTIFLILALLFSVFEKRKFKQQLMIAGSLISLLFSTINFQVFGELLTPNDAIKHAAEYVNQQKQIGEKFYVFDFNNHHPARADFYADEELSFVLEVSELPLDQAIFILVPEAYKEQVLALKQPRDVVEFPYLLMTRPFRSISSKIKGEEDQTQKMYLLDYTD